MDVKLPLQQTCQNSVIKIPSVVRGFGEECGRPPPASERLAPWCPDPRLTCPPRAAGVPSSGHTVARTDATDELLGGTCLPPLPGPPRLRHACAVACGRPWRRPAPPADGLTEVLPCHGEGSRKEPSEGSPARESGPSMGDRGRSWLRALRWLAGRTRATASQQHWLSETGVTLCWGAQTYSGRWFLHP